MNPASEALRGIMGWHVNGQRINKRINKRIIRSR